MSPGMDVVVRLLACLSLTGVGFTAMWVNDDIRRNDLCDSFLECIGIPVRAQFEPNVETVGDRLNEDTPNGRVRGNATLPER